VSAERLLDPRERQRLEEAIGEALLSVEGLKRALLKALEALAALEAEDRALGALYASLPREGHRLLGEILQEIRPRLEALCGPLREVLHEGE